MIDCVKIRKNELNIYLGLFYYAGCENANK